MQNGVVTLIIFVYKFSKLQRTIQKCLRNKCNSVHIYD